VWAVVAAAAGGSRGAAGAARYDTAAPHAPSAAAAAARACVRRASCRYLGVVCAVRRGHGCSWRNTLL
jgi:hypothetical protein